MMEEGPVFIFPLVLSDIVLWLLLSLLFVKAPRKDVSQFSCRAPAPAQCCTPGRRCPVLA